MYLCSEKRINDAAPLDVIWLNDSYKDSLQTYLESKEMEPYAKDLEFTSKLIDGFESPFEMELLATVDWLLEVEHCSPDVESLLTGLKNWKQSSPVKRKMRLFDEHAISIVTPQLRHPERVFLREGSPCSGRMFNISIDINRPTQDSMY